MKNIMKKYGIVSIVLIISTLLSLCNFTTFLSHANQTNSSESNCYSSCTSHNQLATKFRLEAKNESNVEPTPKNFTWPIIQPNILILYTCSYLLFIVLWYLYEQRKIPLTSLLRF